MGVNEDGSPKEAAGAKAGFEQWALKTAGGIIGGLGLTAWMAIVGSAVVWARFQEAGLPGLQAIAAQPHNELVIQGSKTTLVFAALGLAAVGILYAMVPHDSEAVVAGAPTKPAAGEPQKIGPFGTVALVLLAIGAVAWAATTSLDLGWIAVLAALAGCLLWLCLTLGHNERKNFWAMAGALFVSVVVYAGVAEFFIVKDQNFVQAVAALPADEKTEGVSGFYVAVDGETLYFAHSNLGAEAIEGESPKHKPMEKIELGASATYAIGPLEGEADAAKRAEAMLSRLKSDRRKNPATPKSAESGEDSAK